MGREQFRLSPTPGAEQMQWIIRAQEEEPPGGAPGHVRIGCPACARRTAMRVAVDCPACRGRGVIEFDYDADLYDTADDACDAIVCLLEEAARARLEPNPTAQGIEDARELVSLVADRIRSEGLGRDLAEVPITEPCLIDAPPLQFDYDGKPLELGGIPNFSREGYLSFLMRACDPLDPLDVVEGDTARRVTERQLTRMKARRLAKALLMSDEERLKGRR